MKKFFALTVGAAFLWTAAFMVLIALPAEAQEESDQSGQSRHQEPDWMNTVRRQVESLPLCTELTPDLMKGVKAKKKTMKNGVLVLMKSQDTAALQKIQEVLDNCRLNPGTPEVTGSGDRKKVKYQHLLQIRGIQMAAALEQGVLQVQLTAAQRPLIERIKAVQLKAKAPKKKK